ncbi:MAG: type II toxin-antitoxin system HicB family antitoxin, partial [Caulobacteraceae bacterium]
MDLSFGPSGASRVAHRYTALIDGKAGAYGVSFPDLPGCVAMGRTVDGALLAAAEALREFDADAVSAGARLPSPSAPEHWLADAAVAAALKAGASLASVPLVRASAHSAKANLSINAGLLAAIDAEAARRGLTRSAL